MNNNDFSEMGKMLKEQKPVPQKNIFKNKTFPLLFLVTGLLLVFTSSAFAYQYFLEKIIPCSQSTGGICFDIVKENASVSKYQIKNLDENTNYRLTIRKKVGDKTVDIGSVDLNREDINSKIEKTSCASRQESSDSPNFICCKGNELKNDLWNDGSWSQFTCCGPSECAQDGVCIQNGKQFDSWGKKCSNGAWISTDGTSVSCTDSDGGKNYDSKGQVVRGDFAVSDQCSNETELLEVYCENDELRREFHNCEAKCSEGACVGDALKTGCSDSDGGKNFSQKGQLNWFTQGYVVDDYCDSSTGKLVEYSCNENEDMYESTEYDCPNNCVDGACCNAHSEYSSDKNSLNCCGDLELKDDLWMQNEPDFINYGCCKPDECLQDSVCVPDKEDHSADWGVVCNSGVWEGTLK